MHELGFEDHNSQQPDRDCCMLLQEHHALIFSTKACCLFALAVMQLHLAHAA
jgi:hypothetical protein